MRAPINIFKGTTGLNIVDDPVRLSETDLQVAVNISVDRSGRPRSRPRIRSLQSGAYHSLFCDRGDCFVVSGTVLYQVGADGSLSTVRSGLTPSRMAFSQVGDRTYYTNGHELGYILGGVHNTWEEGTYVGPETHRHFSGPLPGHHLEAFFGRMLISNENALFWSEPYNFGLFNLAASFIQFHSKITMMKTNDSGLFLSTEKNTYFLTGPDPAKWTLRQVANYPAVEWSCAIDYFNAADLGLDVAGRCAVWASSEGAIMGLPDGNVVNLNKRKIIYPEAVRTGFGGLFGYNFIHGVK